MELTRTLPCGITIYEDLAVTFIYKQDTDADRRMIFACTKDRKLYYFPSAQLFAIEPTYEDVQAITPVYSYGTWAQCKNDPTVKFKVAIGTLPLHAVVPRYLWRL